MDQRQSRMACLGVRSGLAVWAVLGVGVLMAAGTGWAGGWAAFEPPVASDHRCTSDLDKPGTMSDIISNAMVHRLEFTESQVRPFLDRIHGQHATGAALLAATAAHFKLDPGVLAAEVEKYRHCNCRLGPMPDGSAAPALARHTCTVDLSRTGDMRVIVSNTLITGLNQPDPSVGRFLAGAEQRFATGPELLAATAKHFKLDEAMLAAEVDRYRHCTCTMADVIGGVPETKDRAGERAGVGDVADAGGGGDAAKAEASAEVSAFAKDVTLHVVLHELAHALIREFDLAVLGNEETAADAFATYYLTTYMPDRALDVLKARVTSLAIEASESPVDHWRGEHDHDGRRAFQIAAMAVAADAQKYAPVGEIVGMGERDIARAKDYGAENRRSWRRALAPLWMPEGEASKEARVMYDPGHPFTRNLCGEGIAGEIEGAIKRFDWHSTVTVRFVDGEGGAGWSRSSRTITVNSQYVRRFVAQGAKGMGTTK